MKTGTYKLSSGLLGFILPPIVGTFAVCVTTTLRDNIRHLQYAFLFPIMEPFVFLYAFLFMGLSSAIYAVVMTWLGIRENKRPMSRKPSTSFMLFLSAGVLLGLLSPLGEFIWKSNGQSWTEFFVMCLPNTIPGAITGAICSIPLFLLQRRIRADERRATLEV